MMSALLRCIALALLLSSTTGAEERTERGQPTEQGRPTFSSADLDFFERKVRPLLVDNCLKCHGQDESKVRGGLWLTSREGMLAGGDSGPAILPGDPENSLLIKAIRHEEFEMPPDGKLSDEQITTMTNWIERGAPDPRRPDPRRADPRRADAGAHRADDESIDIEEGRQFWAFRPPRAVAPPEVLDGGWPDTPVDHFILARLEQEGLRPVADAGREVVLRRAYFALIGLPPDPDDIDRFTEDPESTPIALAQVIDRLLQSPRFGERWGRHWLDVARFAESSGGGRSLMFPNAWRYRDYVIESMNRDKPYDRFVVEQIAGDLLPFDSPDRRAEQLVASGFLVLGPTNYEQQDKELLRMEVIDEQLDTVGRAFLGMTLGCARCHDHKFDPIPTSDYYALAGIFGSTRTLVPGNVSGYIEEPLPPTPEESRAEREYEAKLRAMTKQLERATARLVALGGSPSASDDGSPRNPVPSTNLPGIVIDDTRAKLVGAWQQSVHTKPFVDRNYIHDQNQGKGSKSVVFQPTIDKGGMYEVRLSYTPGGNRASNVPVIVDHQDGRTRVTVNQSQTPPLDGLFVSLGTFRFEADNEAAVTVTNEGTDGHVIVDAVQFLSADEPTDSDTESSSDAEVAARPTDGEGKRQADVEQADTARQDELNRAEEDVRRLDARLKELKKNAPKQRRVAMSVRDEERPADGHIHIRGGVRNLGAVVPRGFLRVASAPEARPPSIAEGSSGRMELAHWIADKDNPLTARVYVNRVWRHLFGFGLVETPDNFGRMGRRPSHPELLDHLALKFVADGWSTKKLIRYIMCSRVYRLGADHDERAMAVDDRNRLLWRAPRRRLDSEAIRDAILHFSGRLDLTAGGLTIRKITQYDLGYEFDTVRRSVYVPAFRNSMLELFEVFDFANPNLVVGHRNTSTLPTQALYMMNSPFVIREARHAASRLLVEPELDDRGRVELAYRRALGRFPSEPEMATALRYVRGFEADDPHVEDRLEAWSSLCHSLLASLDFRYVE